MPWLVSLGLAPPCRSGVGIQSTTAFQQKALTICTNLVWRLFITRECCKVKPERPGIPHMEQLVFAEMSFWLHLHYVLEQWRKPPFPILQYTAFIKMASNNVRSSLNLVKVSGKTKEGIGRWKRAGSFSRRLRRDHPSVTQKEIPNFSICDEGFLHRSWTQDASMSLWRNLRIFTRFFFDWFFKYKYYM